MSRACVLAALVVAGSSALAQDLRGTTSTIGRAREHSRWDDSVPVIPIYQLLSLQLTDLAIPGMEPAQLVMSGWGRLQSAHTDLEPHDGDLGLLYLQARRGPVSLRVGRQHVLSAPGRMRLLDGVDATMDLPWGVSAAGFFGAVVAPRFAYNRGSWQTGTRVAKTLPGPGRLGVTLVHERMEGRVAYEEVGLDGYLLLGPVRLLGLVSASPREHALVVGRVAASWLASNQLILTTDVERVTPDLLIPATSMFSVFASATHDSIGAEGEWRPDAYWTLFAGADLLRMNGESLGYRSVARLTTYREPEHVSLIGMETVRLDEDQNGYVRGRLWSSLKPWPVLRLSSEIYIYRFDAPVNGILYSAGTYASGTYDLAPSWGLVVSIAAGTSPAAQVFVEGMVRLAYDYDFNLAEERAP
jgi:hypothetical protein